ncbi:serine/threonine protein kinase [Actibacterium ureilyticum]|uniref:serine/threonine protein kinase n=1 Tax=Actibacterium ureilyticum TaxID=1590614 RepID=UPI000BAB0673|nr:serine/threonine protein kinase [Actibacterium ureilyticum]
MATSRPGDIFQPGDLLNNTYRVEAILGRGGTSEVYKARSEISGRVVALKALKSEFSMNDDYLALMTREEDMREVRHDAIVRYFDNQRMADGQVYLVMDYVDGPGLDQVMTSGPIPPDDVLRVAKCVAGGLVAAHERGIVHRDLSPDNIILRGGDPSDAVIIDFGIAKDTNPGAETIVGNEFAGKYAYAAPEQLSGGTDARSDLYSLGALLLAALRGAKPDMGRNPMEVVQKKAEPLDVSGIPEPMAGLIAKMSAPDPADRFQSARALLSALMTGQIADAPAGDDATVVTLPPKPAETGGGGRLWVPLVVVLALGGAGAGAWFSGLLDGVFTPSLPVAAPYTLVIDKPQDAAPSATGHVPSDTALAALAGLMGDQGGRADLELAQGEIAESWGDDIVALTDSISRLPEYRIDASGNTVRITGLTEDRALRDALESAALPGALTGTVQIELGPRLFPPDRIAPLLERFADCGALALVDPPLLGYGQTDTINIAGKLADVGARAQLRDAIAEMAGDRSISIDAELLNPALCQVETALPDAPSGGITTQFGFGDRPDINPTGRYFVGENPVIDIVLPAGVTDGFLWVSVLDVSGNVFHLLPNVNRPENDIAVLRDGVAGPVPVRVAYSVAEGDSPARLAFLVDDTTLGKSKILVLASDQDLFGGIRPTTESIASYTEALIAAQSSGAQVRSLDSAILTTAQK